MPQIGVRLLMHYPVSTRDPVAAPVHHTNVQHHFKVSVHLLQKLHCCPASPISHIPAFVLTMDPPGCTNRICISDP